MIYTFIESQKTNHRVSAMCRALKVSRSGFYGWRDRPPSARARADAVLLSEKIARIHTDSRGTYGAPRRIHFELRTPGVRCARKRVARLMREAGLCSDAVGVGGGRLAPPSARGPRAYSPEAPDLVERNFTPAGAPNRLWVAETSRTCVYLGGMALPLVRARHLLQEGVVGWSMANNLRSELVLDALNMAIYTRRPQPGLIHHSDRGSQYASVDRACGSTRAQA